MKEILIIGPYISNIGGVSIHIRRLVHLLKDDYTFDFIDEGRKRNAGVYNIRSLNPFPYFKKIIKSDIVHIHSGVPILRLFHIIICLLLFKKTIVTIHRDINIEKRKKLTRFFLHKCSKVIAVNQNTYDYINDGKFSNQLTLLPAFLPPIMEEEKGLPDKLKLFIKNCKNAKGKLLVSNASYLAIHNDQDLYGLDLCIEAIDKLKSSEPQFPVFLIFVIADDEKNLPLLKSYETLINQSKLSDRILIWKGGVSFVKLILQADIVLRTTNTDGDALSIRESLFFNKPVIASDIVTRPEGTILFKTRNVASLIDEITDTLNQSGNCAMPSQKAADSKNIYTSIYNSL